MKTTLLITAALMLPSAAQASCWAFVMKGNDLICEVRGPKASASYRAPDFDNVGDPNYQSRSQTIIRTPYGTSVINGTYRSYSR